MIEDIGSEVVATGYYSIEFQTKGVFHHIYIRFWHKGQLVRVYLKRTGLRQGKTSAELSLISHVNNSISTRPDIVACMGSSPETVDLLHKFNFFQHRVQSPYRFDILSAKDLMNKSSYSVFDRIDFFFVSQFFVISLGGCLSQDWTLTAPELTKVRRTFIISSSDFQNSA